MSASQDYVLGRDFKASNRLTAQHGIIKIRYGGLLHPSIKQHLAGRESACVIDVACGNGIWALEMASEYPSFQIVATDVSTRQFPPAWSRSSQSSTVQFLQQDLLEPIPADLVGKFDLVHAAFFLATAPDSPKRDDPTFFLKQFHRLLRPGGYLQWHEVVFPGTRRITEKQLNDILEGVATEPEPVLAAITATTFIAGFEEKLKMTSKDRWEESLSGNGMFENVEVVTPPINVDLLGLETRLLFDAALEIADAFHARPHVPETTIQAVRENIDEIRERVESGELMSYMTTMGIAKRPSDQR